MKLFVVAVLIAMAGAVVSAEVFYSRNTVPAPWSLGEPAPQQARVDFTIALRQRNLDILDKWFTEVSDPLHHNYQDYKSIDEIRDLVSPAESELEALWTWLHSADIHHVHTVNLGDALDVHCSVAQAERLFKTKMFVFAHEESGAKIIRAWGDYSVPDCVSGSVDMVTGLSTFPIPHLTVRRPTASNDYGIVPQTIDAMYSITQEARRLLSPEVSGIATSQGVIEFQGQNFSPKNLATFGQGVEKAIQPVPANQTIGPNDPTDPQTEAELDIQMVASVNLGASNWFWLEKGNGWLYQFVSHFFATKTVPQVSSISYGWWEGDQCSIDQDECSALGVTSKQYTERVNVEFQKIALRGVTLFSASGDSGANGRTDPECTIKHLRPAFPGSSPYVTAVGATELTATTPLSNAPSICKSAGLECVVGGHEQAVSYAISGFASGGGFSDIAAQPSYQSAAVAAYFKSGVKFPDTGYFNRSGRGFPDVGALGHNVLIYTQGGAQPVGGTSASSPIFASVLALLNVASIQKTGKPIGFANPFLYKMHADCEDCFQDIIVGNNRCTENGCATSCQGYECAKGWDPVTGLGSPNFAKMLDYVKAGRHMKRLPTRY